MNGTGRNYYSVLEVSRHSTPMEIRQAYKKVSKKLHPDKNPSPNADVMFQEVKVAYDVSQQLFKSMLWVRPLRCFKSKPSLTKRIMCRSSWMKASVTFTIVLV